MRVLVAEGMETHAQSRLLTAGQIRYQQGFYHAKPMPAKEINSLYHLAK